MATATHSIFDSFSDETDWVVQIKDMYTELDREFENCPVCVYHVPKYLSSASPESYVPQLIALGPYHHFRPELYPMERFKLTSARKVLKYFQDFPLDKLINQLKDQGCLIRACYHKYLDLKDETLGCALAVDGLFFLHLLHNYVSEEGLLLSGLRHMGYTTGVKLTKDAIIKDVLMLENQIPNFILRKMLAIISSNNSNTDVAGDSASVEKDLISMQMNFCEALSPLPIVNKSYNSNPRHVLDLMYYLILPSEESPDQPLFDKADSHIQPNSSAFQFETNDRNPSSRKKTICCSSCNAIKQTMKPFTHCVKNCLKGIQSINMPLLKPIQTPIKFLLKAFHVLKEGASTSPTEIETPMVVMIPSVTQLHSVGVQFQCSKGGITTIEFDEKTHTLYIPKIRLDVNSEVVMRNLVAYEAITKSESLVFTRYTELMRAIVDKVEDVELLIHNKIIVSSLDKDEVAKLFNGMSKSIGPTKTPRLNETIEKVNKYYNGTRKVRAYKMMTKYVYSSWKLFTLLATLLLLGLMGIQTFCSVYSCPSLFKTTSSS